MEAIYSDYYPIFIYVDKYRFSKNWVYPSAPVPYSLVRYVVSGTATFSLGDTHYEVGPGDVFYIPQGSILSCAAKEEIVFISIRFIGSIQLASTDMLQMLWKVPIQHNFADTPDMLSYFERVYASALTRSTFKMLEIRGYLNLICAQLARVSKENFNRDSTLEEDRRNTEAHFDAQSIRHRAEKSARTNKDPRITIIVDTIITHPEKNFTSKELCELAGFSESTLRRLFKEQTGKTLYDFIKDTKMTNAARKLLVTNEPISSIAYELGYEAPSYFAKCFKEVFGISPLEYRRTSHEM